MTVRVALGTPTRARVGLALAGGLLLGLVLLSQRPDSSQALPDVMTVEMRGRDFLFHFVYPGPDNVLGTSDDLDAGNELRLPAGTTVDVLISSDDYVYALTIPAFDQRQVAIPGRTRTVTLHPLATGSYDILTDPLCSVRFLHDERMGSIRVESPAAFLNWLNTVQ